jgi:hypothetical protein
MEWKVRGGAIPKLVPIFRDSLEAATRREIYGLSTLILTEQVKIGYYLRLLIMDLIQIRL